MRAVDRHDVVQRGLPGGRPMLFVHGFGCDKAMWRHVWPAFETTHRIVLFDHVGAGGADPRGWDPLRHATLDGYAQDVPEVCEELDLTDIIFVGHSVSAIVGVLAANRAPERFGQLVLVSPSPRYVDAPEDGYVGGFSEEDIEELLEALETDHLSWSRQMAPVIMGVQQPAPLAEELTASFCRMDPRIGAHFARTTFTSDNRADLARVETPSLVLQCADDVIAPTVVGEYVHRSLRGSRLVYLEATGHCPNLSAPEETVTAIREHLAA